MAIKDKKVFKIPVQINGRTVANVYVAHGFSDSLVASLAMAHPDVVSALGDWGEIETVSAVPFQPVNIITKSAVEVE